MKLLSALACIVLCTFAKCDNDWFKNFQPRQLNKFCKTQTGSTFEPISVLGSENKFDVPQIFKDNKYRQHESLALFRFSLQNKVKFGIKTTVMPLFIVQVEKNVMMEELLNSIKSMEGGLLLTRSVECVVFQDFYYVLMDYEALDAMCINSNYDYKSPERNADKGKLKKLYEKEPVKKIGEGGYGVVRKTEGTVDEMPTSVRNSLGLKEGTMWLAIKRMSLEHTNIQELLVGIVFGNIPAGVKFFGCEFEGDVIYVAQELLAKQLDDDEVREDFVTWPQAKQLRLFHKMMAALKQFHDMGFTHNDIKPGNIMLDTAGEPRLIDYGMVGRIGGFNTNGYSPHFIHPARMTAKNSLAHFDIYSMIMTYVSFYLYYGETNLMYVPLDKIIFPYTAREADIFCQPMNDQCRRSNTSWLEIGLEPVFGAIDESVNELNKMNFSTLCYKIVEEQKIYKIEDILSRLDRIATYAELREAKTSFFI